MTGVVLTDRELLAAWHVLDLGEPPVELELRTDAGTVADQQRATAAALARLRARGLADQNGPSTALAHPLWLLAHAPLTLDLRLCSGLVALGAVDGGQGAVLLCRNGELRLRTIAGPAVPATLVELLGPPRTGRGRAVNLPAEVLDDARREVRDGSWWTLADRLIDRGVDRRDACALARMCIGITARGQLGATARAGHVEQRGGWVIGFHRAAVGDFVQLRRDRTVTIAPITTATLHTQLRELIAHLPAPGSCRGGGSY